MEGGKHIELYSKTRLYDQAEKTHRMTETFQKWMPWVLKGSKTISWKEKRKKRLKDKEVEENKK